MRLILKFTFILLISYKLGISSALAAGNLEPDYLLSVDLNQGLTRDSSDLVPKEAQLKQIRYRIPRENPDKLVAQIVLKYPLQSDNSFPDSNWIIGLWLYGPGVYCYNLDGCNFILEIQPSFGNQAIIYSHQKKISFETRTKLDCPTSWYLSNDTKGDSLISFNLSITCLGIEKSFASYAFSSYDNGVTSRPWQFTQPNYVENGYFQLAEKSYNSNGGKQGLSNKLNGPDFDNLENLISKVRDNFDTWRSRFDSLAEKSKVTVAKNSNWRAFLEMEMEIVAIENEIESGFVNLSNITTKIKIITKIITKQNNLIKNFQGIYPHYQCYSQSKDLTLPLNNVGKCPKNFKKIKI